MIGKNKREYARPEIIRKNKRTYIRPEIAE
jgi:hypothetical protein